MRGQVSRPGESQPTASTNSNQQAAHYSTTPHYVRSEPALALANENRLPRLHQATARRVYNNATYQLRAPYRAMTNCPNERTVITACLSTTADSDPRTNNTLVGLLTVMLLLWQAMKWRKIATERV